MLFSMLVFPISSFVTHHGTMGGLLFGSIRISIPRELQNPQMPIGPVRRCGAAHCRHRQDEIISPSAVIKRHGIGIKVNTVRNVVPHARLPRGVPLGARAHIPSEQRIARRRLPRDPTGLHLREVRFEEGDLVLAVLGGRVGIRAHHAEVVVDCACGNGSRRLWDQLSPSHGLAVPVGGAVEGDFDALRTACVGGVFVARVQVDV
jgi:hypothetical protein